MREKVFLSIFIPLSLILLIANVTGALKLYKNPSMANEPALKANKRMLVSNLVKPKHGDFICFKHDDKEFGKMIKVFRACGFENDTIEIRKGNLYINGENFDININTINLYKIDKNKFSYLRNNNLISSEYLGYEYEDGDYIVSLKREIATQYNFLDKKFDNSSDNTKNIIKTIYGANWTENNFGPVIVPEDSFFALGDYRDNSLDSRFFGFVHTDNIIGIVVYSNIYSFP